VKRSFGQVSTWLVGYEHERRDVSVSSRDMERIVVVVTVVVDGMI
jgi:hypothetical protein